MRPPVIPQTALALGMIESLAVGIILCALLVGGLRIYLHRKGQHTELSIRNILLALVPAAVMFTAPLAIGIYLKPYWHWAPVTGFFGGCILLHLGGGCLLRRINNRQKRNSKNKTAPVTEKRPRELSD